MCSNCMLKAKCDGVLSTMTQMQYAGNHTEADFETVYNMVSDMKKILDNAPTATDIPEDAAGYY